MRAEAKIATRGAALLCMAGLFWSGAAAAEPGEHIQAGAAEIVPSLTVGTLYRSNIYYAESDPVGGLALVVTPGLDIGVETDLVQFDLGAAYALRKWLVNTRPNAVDASNADEFNNVDLGANLYLLPNSLVGFKIDESFVIKPRTSEAQFGTSALVTRTISDTSAFIVLRPGSALHFDLGGHFQFQNIQSPAGSSFSGSGSRLSLNNKTAYGADLRGYWEFFPRTAVSVDASIDRFDWSDNAVNAVGGNADPEDVGNRLAVPDGWGWRVYGGVRGRVSKKLVVNGMVGYGQLRYDTQSVLDRASELQAAGAQGWEEINVDEGWGQNATGVTGILAYAGVTWTPLTGQSLSAGYKRDIEDSFFTNYVAYNSVFVRYNGALSRRTDAGVEFSYRLENYVGEVNRSDHYLVTNGSLSFAATDWLAIRGQGGWKRRASADTPPKGTIEFDDIQGGLFLDLTY
jgi:hypothetical protein